MLQKKEASLKLLMIRTLKERDLILKEIIKLKNLVFIEIVSILIIVQIPTYCQIEITQAKLRLTFQN